MIELIILSIFIVMIKFSMKTKKYHVKKVANSISRRSLMLTNIHKQATEREVVRFFDDYGFRLKEVTFAYKVNEYWEVLESISKFKKEKDLLRHFDPDCQKKL